jgi:serine/threonine protein kinase
MHSRSIFHNNLSLDNILLSMKGSVNITVLASMGVDIEESEYDVKIIDWRQSRCSTD